MPFSHVSHMCVQSLLELESPGSFHLNMMHPRSITGKGKITSFSKETWHPWSLDQVGFKFPSKIILIFILDENGFGLWIDETLYQGRSQPVKTFNSPSLSSENDFLINNLELWTFTQ